MSKEHSPEVVEVNPVGIDYLIEMELRSFKAHFGTELDQWAHTKMRRALTFTGYKGWALKMGLQPVHLLTKAESKMLLLAGNIRHILWRQPTAKDFQTWPWLEARLLSGDDVVEYESLPVSHPDYRPRDYSLPHYRNAYLWHLCEALKANVNLQKLAPISLARAEQYADDWQKQMEKEATLVEGQIEKAWEQYETETTTIEGKTVKTNHLYQIFHLIDKQSYRREGKLMHHCVGSYQPDHDKHFRSQNDSEQRIYSLREGGKSLATAEVRVQGNRAELVQFYALQDSNPSEIMWEVFENFLILNFEYRGRGSRPEEWRHLAEWQSEVGFATKKAPSVAQSVERNLDQMRHLFDVPDKE